MTERDPVARFVEAVRRGAAPADAVVAAVAVRYGSRLRDELLSELVELVPADLDELDEPEVELETARRCAAQLLRLAAMLPDRRRRDLAAATHLLLGNALVVAGSRAEALTELRAARQLLATDVLPEQIPACELTVADLTGTRAEARRRWEQGREDADPGTAARAAAALAWADLVPDRAADGGERAAALFAEAADLAASAGSTDEATTYASTLGLLAVDRIEEIGDGPSGPAVAIAATARRVTERHAASAEAARLAAMLALYGADVGWPWEQVRRWLRTARAETRALGIPRRQMELRLAGIDFFEGSAALCRGMVVEAEPPLLAVLEVARQQGSQILEQACVRLLGGLRSFTEGADLRRLATVLADQEWRDAESTAGALTIRAVAEWRAGGDRAEQLLGDARAQIESSGVDYKSLLLDLLDAARQLDRGDLAAARVTADKAERFQRERGGSVPGYADRGIAAAQGLLRAALAARSGDPSADPALELQRVEDALVHSGAGLLAAQIACGRAVMLLDAGRFRLALDTVLPAVLALDAVRFTFVDADRRRRWSAGVSAAMTTAFRAAARCADLQVLAELIEITRGHGVPLPQDTASADPFDMVNDQAAQLTASTALTATASAVAGAHVLAGDGTGRTALGLPATLRTPWGSVALADAVAKAARYHQPVRANETVDWVVLIGTELSRA